MKCPRCGYVIAGVELATGQEYADFICAPCENEMDEDGIDEDEREECTCARPRDELADAHGFPCDCCGKMVR